MRILVYISHPAHVHNFRHIIKKLIEKGHIIKILAANKDITLDLLDRFGFSYKVIGINRRGTIFKALDLLYKEFQVLKIATRFKPDLFFSRGSFVMGHISTILRVPYVAFVDSECVWIVAPLVYPFINVIITPYFYRRYLDDRKHIKIPSYKELAYLHPDIFVPDKNSLKYLNLKKGDKYSIVRFVGWDAYHDIGKSGFGAKEKLKIVRKLQKYGKVFISSEKKLPPVLRFFKLEAPSDKIHDILYYADLFIGDSQTMATESALLGTPAIRSNAFVGENDMSNFLELENRYKLLFNYREFEEVVKKIEDIFSEENSKLVWKKRRQKLLSEKINLSDFLVWFIENYPKSFFKIKKNELLMGGYKFLSI